MLTLGIVLCYLLGLSVLLLISRKYSWAEVVGFSFLMGMGIETFFMFFLDIIGIRYSPTVLIGINVFSIVALCGANYKNLSLLKDEFKIPAFSIQQINFVAVFIFCLMAYLLYAVTVKNLFWPPTEHDTIGSFDKLGRVMAAEGRLNISLYKYDLEGAGGLYPPLFHASFAYVYIFGAEIPKIVTTLFFVSLLTSFYGLVKNYVGSTAASLFTFILMVSPEMFSHAALSLGNMPTTAYVCAGALATFTWLDKRDSKYFWLGAIMMAFVIWIRTDTVVFTAAALLIVGIDFLKTKDWKKTLIYGAIAVAPFILWSLYLKMIIGTSTGNKFDLGIGYNTQRMDLMLGYVKAFLFGGQKGAIDGGQLYGLVFWIFFLMLIINLGLIYKKGVKEILLDKLNVLVFFFVSFALYFILFYLIDEKIQRAPISSLMESSFKRGMFCFIPIALFYASTNKAALWLWEKVEIFRKGK
ncbi:MAG: glycosyltransferase family 39 protein [Bacteroidetes bacterium]|nr:glycosyltransferase family 39 protein [Bacteroidota bacterium]